MIDENYVLMKTLSVFFGLALCLTSLQAHNGKVDSAEHHMYALHRVNYPVFKKGEKLEYLIHYGFIDAGIATIEVKNENHKLHGRDVLHVAGTGISKGAFDWFFKVRDYYNSYIDSEHAYPYVFNRDVNEGGYKFKQKYEFLQDENKVKTHKDKVHDVPSGILDMLSAYYFARTIDISKYKVGDVIVLQAFVDEEIEPLKIRYVGKETITTKSGKFRCLKFQPIVQKGRIFNDPEDLTVYITDDKNKVPVMAKANILVGSLKMQLINYEGLSYPLAKVGK
jgi:hypothetical protein